MKVYDLGEKTSNRTTGIVFDGFSDKDRMISKPQNARSENPFGNYENNNKPNNPFDNFDPINTPINDQLLKNADYFSRQIPRNLPAQQDKDKTIRCELILYSPKQNYPHKVRPHVYNFNEYSAVSVMCENHLNNAPIVNNTMFEQIPEMNGMILPANDGHTIDLSKMNDYWTFILICDSEMIDGYKSYQTNCRQKTISTGYCLSEPVNPITHTVNPKAIFKFSHHTKFRFNRNRGGDYGSIPDVIGNYDVIPTEFKMMTGEFGDELVNLSPQYLNPPDPKVFAQKYLSDNFKDDYSDCVVDVLTGIPKHSATKIHADLKSGKKHLHTIAKALDQAKASIDCRENDIDYQNIASTVSSYGDNISTFDMFYKKLSDQKPIIESGITGYEVKQFSDLQYMYPYMKVKVIPIKNPRTWEVYSSLYINSNNTYNAWLSTFLNQFCEAAGIMELVFIYDSYCGNQYEKEGRWQITKLDSIYGDDITYGKRLFNSLKRELESHIFNYLKHTVGDFSLTVNYRSFTDTAINLQFYGEEKINAYYETPTDKAGLITPLIGDQRYAMKNSDEVAMLLTRFDID